MNGNVLAIYTGSISMCTVYVKIKNIYIRIHCFVYQLLLL